MPKVSREERDLQALTKGHAGPASPLECLWLSSLIRSRLVESEAQARSSIAALLVDGLWGLMAQVQGSAERAEKFLGVVSREPVTDSSGKPAAESSPGVLRSSRADFVLVSCSVLGVGLQPRSRRALVECSGSCSSTSEAGQGAGQVQVSSESMWPGSAFYHLCTLCACMGGGGGLGRSLGSLA